MQDWDNELYCELYWLLQQDEYHMLHLVCASRTPPSSPKPPRSRGNKPQENTASPTVGPPCTPHTFPFISSSSHFLSSFSSLLQSVPQRIWRTSLVFLSRWAINYINFRTDFSAYSPFRTQVVLPLVNIASHRLQKRTVMNSDSEPDISPTTRCIHNWCTGKSLDWWNFNNLCSAELKGVSVSWLSTAPKHFY